MSSLLHLDCARDEEVPSILLPSSFLLTSSLRSSCTAMRLWMWLLHSPAYPRSRAAAAPVIFTPSPTPLPPFQSIFPPAVPVPNPCILSLLVQSGFVSHLPESALLLAPRHFPTATQPPCFQSSNLIKMSLFLCPRNARYSSLCCPFLNELSLNLPPRALMW
jgi:hypothetical protein